MSVFFGIDFHTIAADAAVNALQQGFAGTLTGAIAKAEARAFVMADKTAKSLLTIGDDLRWVARNAAEIDLALGGDSLDQANARLARTKDTLAAAKIEAEKLAEAIKQEQAAIGGMDASKIQSLGAALSEARKKETAALHAYNAAQRAVTSEAAKAEATQRAAAQAAAEDLRRQQAAADSLGLSVRELRQQATQVDFSLGADTLEAAKARVDAFKVALEQAKNEARAVAAEVARTDATQLSTKDTETLALRAKAAKEQETRALQAYSQAQRDVQSHEARRDQQENLAIQRSQRLFGALNEVRGMFGDLRDVFEITGQALLGFNDAQQKAAEHMAYSAEKGAMLGLAGAELGERLGLSAKNALYLGGALGALGTVATFVLSAYSEYVNHAKEATDALKAARQALADSESQYARDLLINGKASVDMLDERLRLIYREQEAARAAAEANRGFWVSSSESAASAIAAIDDYTGGWIDLGRAQADATLEARSYELAQADIAAGAASVERLRTLWKDTAGAIEENQKQIGDTWIELANMGREKSLKELGEDAKAARDRLSEVSDDLAGLRAVLNRPAPAEFGAALLDQFEKMRAVTLLLPKAQRELGEATQEATRAEGEYQGKKKQGADEASRARKKEQDEAKKAEEERAKALAKIAEEQEKLDAARIQRIALAQLEADADEAAARVNIASVKEQAITEANERDAQKAWWESNGRTIAEERQAALDKYLLTLREADVKNALETIDRALSDLGNTAVRELSGRAAKAATDFFDRLSDPRVSLAAQKQAAKEARAARLKELGSEMIGEGTADELRALSAAALGNFASAGALAGVGAAKIAFGFGLGGIGARQARKAGAGSRSEAPRGGGFGGGGASPIRSVSEAARGPVAPTVINVTLQSLVPGDQSALEAAGAAVTQALSAHARAGGV